MPTIPKYQKIMNYISAKIDDKTFVPGVQLPTEQTLADIFDTSRPTAVKALDRLKDMGIIYRKQGSGSFVCTERKESYEHNSRIISVILPFAQYRSSARIDEINILKGIEHRLNQHGYFTMIHYCNDDGQSFLNTFKAVKQFVSVGIIAYVAKGIIECNDIYDLLLSDLPLVLIDKSILGTNAPCIRSDNVNGGYIATKHLIDCNYSSIYFLTDYNMLYNESFRERYIGFCQAVQENNGSLTFGHFMLNPQDTNTDELETIAKQIMEDNPGKRVGIFCTGDYFAKTVFNVFEKLGADIPNQYGIVGFDGLGIKTDNNMSLTTVSQDYYKIGKVASETILKIIHDAPILPETIKTSVSLVSGDTTKLK